VRHHGTSRSYLLDRLRREGREDLVTAVESGTITAYAAATAVGLVTRHRTTGTGSKSQAKRREHRLNSLLRKPPALSGAAVQDLWLGLGTNRPPQFESDEARHEAWLRNREWLMATLAQHGRRPLAWWRYDAGDLRYPGYDRERSTLYEAGMLAEDERAELVAHWREEFDRAHRPDFFCCEGPGRFFHGEPARRAHYRWADIPSELVEEWSAEPRSKGSA
jgi:hypothetical protein